MYITEFEEIKKYLRINIVAGNKLFVLCGGLKLENFNFQSLGFCMGRVVWFWPWYLF